MSNVLGEEQTESLRHDLEGQTLSGAPVHAIRGNFLGSGEKPAQGFEVFAHRRDGVPILEWEAADAMPPAESPALYAGVRNGVARLQAARQSIPDR